MENAYVDYKPPTETYDETFANTEMKEYVDLDSKTKQLLEVKHQEGKVEFLDCYGNWSKKNKALHKFFNDVIYRVVWHTENCNKSSFLEEIFQGRWIFVVLAAEK